MKICSVPSISETAFVFVSFLAEIKRNVIQDSTVPLCHSTVLVFLSEMPPPSCQTGKLLEILHQPVEILLFLQSLPESSKQSKGFVLHTLLVCVCICIYTHTPNSYTYICMHDKSLWLCLTFCDPMDYSPPGSSVHGILQARTLEWVAMPFSRGSSRPRDRTHVSYVSCIEHPEIQGQILQIVGLWGSWSSFF